MQITSMTPAYGVERKWGELIRTRSREWNLWLPGGSLALQSVEVSDLIHPHLTGLGSGRFK